jgi:hypothetical protein
MSRTCTCHLHGAPNRHAHEFSLRRNPTTRAKQDAVVWAVWLGGSAEVATWNWDTDGLDQAQRWCDHNGAIWERDGRPVTPNSLHIHADVI